MNPTQPTSTATRPLDQWSKPELSQAPERVVRVFDTVKVSPDTFQSVMFMSSQQKKEFTKERGIPNADKPQKRNQDGVPIWAVQLAVVNWRGMSELVSVSIPLHSDPMETFRAGEPVHLPGLVFGVTAKRDGGGFVTWCSADDLQSAGARIKAAS